MNSSSSNSSVDPSNRIVNVPNFLSTLRLVLAVAVGVLIEFQAFFEAMWIFIFAASTDFVDGYWARRFNQITKLGRVLDPFVDKIIISASMIALVAYPESCIRPWMVTVIIGRELLVTSLRSMVEGKGGDFSARWLGKWKMLAQCSAVVASLLLLGNPNVAWLYWTTQLLVWIAVILTIASGADYVRQIVVLGRSKSAAIPPSLN